MKTVIVMIMKVFRSEQGFALLELLVSMAIISIAVFGTIVLTETSARLQGDSNNRMEAVNDVLVSERERILAMPAPNNVALNTTVVNNPATPSTNELTEYTTNHPGYLPGYNYGDLLTGGAISPVSVVTGTYLVGNQTGPPQTATTEKFLVYRYVICLETGGSCSGASRRLVRIVIEARGSRVNKPYGLVSDEFIYVNCKLKYEAAYTTDATEDCS